MVTSKEMQALAYMHGFNQVQKGCKSFVNQYAETVTEEALKKSMLQADVQNKSSLTAEHARRALKQTTGVPNGSY